MTQINLDELKTMAGGIGGISAVAQQAQKNLGILDNQLLTLRLNFGKLRASIERAFAPLTATVTPMLNSAIRAVTDFCDDAGSVMAALFGTVYKKTVTTTKATGSAVRRSLASFDKLERLNGGSGGSGSTTSVKLEPVNDALTPQLQKIVDTIRAVMEKLQSLIAPLKDIDVTPAADAFRRLGSAIGSFGMTVLTGLETAWHTLLVPLAKWCIEAAVPASVELLTAAFSALGAAFAPVKAGISQLQSALAPVAQFLKDTVILALQGVESRLVKLAAVFAEKTPAITGTLQNLGVLFRTLWEAAAPAFENLRTFWAQVMDAMGTAAAGFTGTATGLLHSLTEFLAGAFTGNWGRAWEGVKALLRTAVNGIIGLLNSLLNGLTAGINAVARSLNSISVTVPSWVPVFGGRQFGFRIPTVTAPQIPYLAQGAVLPANRPFLAMVGDQRHGTNIEAPLSVIQEAVALVMQGQTEALMAGHEATVSVLREILEAVLGISISDEVIASAVDRSRSRQAVMKGAYHAF